MTKKTPEKRERKREAPAKIEQNRFFGLPLDPDQLLLANTIWSEDYDIVFVNSVAGTGKTTVATGVAKLLVDFGRYDSIVYIMSPYGERQQGWLPGTIEEKSSVYFDAFYQALIAIGINVNTDVTQEADPRQNKKPYISCITDTYLRGCNLNHAVVIIDEAQNFTIPQLKKILTRVCKDTKVIVIGHELQCDLDKPELSGFKKYIDHFKGESRCAVCSLTKNHRGWISTHADTLRENGIETKKNDPVLFWNHWDLFVGCFAQWYEAPIEEGGISYFCCEQYMMAGKAALFNDSEAYDKIMSSHDPKEIQKLGREVKNFDQATWDEYKEEIVYNGNLLKFSQHEDIKHILLETGNRLIAEASPYDLIWGIGYRKTDPEANSPERWRGKNLLGKALMRVRETLRGDGNAA